MRTPTPVLRDSNVAAPVPHLRSEFTIPPKGKDVFAWCNVRRNPHVVHDIHSGGPVACARPWVCPVETNRHQCSDWWLCTRLARGFEEFGRGFWQRVHSPHRAFWSRARCDIGAVNFLCVVIIPFEKLLAGEIEPVLLEARLFRLAAFSCVKFCKRAEPAG